MDYFDQLWDILSVKWIILIFWVIFLPLISLILISIFVLLFSIFFFLSMYYLLIFVFVLACNHFQVYCDRDAVRLHRVLPQSALETNDGRDGVQFSWLWKRYHSFDGSHLHWESHHTRKYFVTRSNKTVSFSRLNEWLIDWLIDWLMWKLLFEGGTGVIFIQPRSWSAESSAHQADHSRLHRQRFPLSIGGESGTLETSRTPTTNRHDTPPSPTPVFRRRGLR